MGDGGRFQKVREERAGRRNRCKWKAQGGGGGGEGEGKGLEEKNPVEEKKRGFSLCFLLFFLFFFFFFFLMMGRNGFGAEWLVGGGLAHDASRPIG